MTTDFEKFVSEHAERDLPDSSRLGFFGSLFEGVRRGAARAVGGIGDVPASLYQGAKALGGFVANPPSSLTNRPELMPEVNIPATTMFQDYLLSAWANPEIKPGSGSERTGLRVGEAMGSSMYPAGLIRAPAGATLAEILKTAAQDTAKNEAIAAISGLGASAGSELSGGNAVAELAGGLAAPATYIAGSPLLMAARVAAKSVPEAARAAAGRAPGMADKYIRDKIVAAAAGSPGSAQNAEQALRIAAKIGPGFKPSIGEMTGAPALIDLESKFAGTSAQTLNREAARRATNEAAIRAAYEASLPQVGASDVASTVNRAIEGETQSIQAAREAVTGALPAIRQTEVGANILQGAKETKAQVQKTVITPAYEEAFRLAGEAKTTIEPVLQAAKDVLGETITKVKPDVAPNTVSAIRALQAKAPVGSPVASPATLARLPGLARGGLPAAPIETEATLREIDGIHRAINMDVRTALASGDQAAAMRARNLMRLHDAVDEAITKGTLPDQAKNSYATALETWRQEFKPRFKEGVNLQLLQGSRRNEPSALRLDEITGKYFVSGGEVEAQQFANLAGGNTSMRDQLSRGIMDIYRSEVTHPQTGLLDVQKHNAFMQKYEKPLSVLSENGMPIRSDLQKLGRSLKSLSEREANLNEISRRIGYESTDQLVSSVLTSPTAAYNAARILGPEQRGSLTRAIMDRVWENGAGRGELNAQAMQKFISDNRSGLLNALTASEGAKEGSRHLQALENISKAAEIATRGRSLGGVGGFSDDPLRAATGVSLSTVMSQARGVQMGRTSVPVAASMMAGPILRKLGLEKFDELMYGAMQDKTIAENLSGLLKAQEASTQKWFATRLWDAWKENRPVLIAGMKRTAATALGTQAISGNIQRSVVPALSNVAENVREAQQ